VKTRRGLCRSAPDLDTSAVVRKDASRLPRVWSVLTRDVLVCTSPISFVSNATLRNERKHPYLVASGRTETSNRRISLGRQDCACASEPVTCLFKGFAGSPKSSLVFTRTCDRRHLWLPRCRSLLFQSHDWHHRKFRVLFLEASKRAFARPVFFLCGNAEYAYRGQFICSVLADDKPEQKVGVPIPFARVRLKNTGRKYFNMAHGRTSFQSARRKFL